MDILRIIELILALVGLILICRMWMKYKLRRYLLVAPLLYLVNITLFLVYRILTGDPNVVALNLWSLVIHLQGLFSVVGGLFIFWRR